MEIDVAPEVRREFALFRRGFRGWRTVRLHSTALSRSESEYRGLASLSVEEGLTHGLSLSPMSVCAFLGMIMLHSKHDQTLIAKHIGREDVLNSPERGSVRDGNEIIGRLSDHQTVLHGRRTEDRGHSGHDQ